MACSKSCQGHDFSASLLLLLLILICAVSLPHFTRGRCPVEITVWYTFASALTLYEPLGWEVYTTAFEDTNEGTFPNVVAFLLGFRL